MITIGHGHEALNTAVSVQIDRQFSLGQQLESVFLAEMLKVSGVGETPETFGGGVGEDQFSSFLREAQAREMVLAGGLGLANRIDRSIGFVK